MNLFQSILKLSEDQEGSLSETFKLELDQRFNFGIKNFNVNDDHDSHDEIIGDRMKIFVKHETKRLAVDKDAVIVNSNSAPDSPVALLRQISSSFFGNHEQPQPTHNEP